MEGRGAPAFTPNGRIESDNPLFIIPNMAVSYRLNWSLIDVVGFTVYGNGGMNTNYRPNRPAGSTPCPALGQDGIGGVFCGGPTGVNLQQAFVSIAAAKTIMPGLSIGVAPILARQQFEGEGMRAFGIFSTDPRNLSNAGTDVSYGGGVRAGIEWAIASGFRLGVAGNSRIYMQEFDKYRGLFAEQGDFDIPASLQAGVSVDLLPSLTFSADYKRIWYGSIAAIANPQSAIAGCNPTGATPGVGTGCLGADDGAGFGWKDVDVVKLGLEWRASPIWTLRAGYSYNTNPVTKENVTFNILAPGVVQHHVTAGAQVKVSSKIDVEVAGMIAPENSVIGDHFRHPAFGPLGAGHTTKIGMDQAEVTVGLKYKLD
jgi:long-chain fatty acid transport protein